VTSRSEFLFTSDRSVPLDALRTISSGTGWCNVIPRVSEDVASLTPNVLQLFVKKGAPVATYVPAIPKRGLQAPASLGVLHTHHKLPDDVVASILDGAPFTLRQNHNQRGLLFNVPVGSDPEQILTVMCTAVDLLCDYEREDGWRFELFLRDT